MSQTDFARAIGRSPQSVQGYEHGRIPPPEVVESLKSLAAQCGRADLAVALTSDEWKVRHVITPGEILISDHREPAAGTNAHWHKLLDDILDSNDPDALTGVQASLVVFGKYVQGKKGLKTPAKPKRKLS